MTWRWNSVRTGHTKEPPALHGGVEVCGVCVSDGGGARKTDLDVNVETCEEGGDRESLPRSEKVVNSVLPNDLILSLTMLLMCRMFSSSSREGSSM